MFEKIIIMKVFVIVALQCTTDNQYEYLSKNLTDNNQFGTMYCTQKYNVGDTIKIPCNVLKQINVGYEQANTSK